MKDSLHTEIIQHIRDGIASITQYLVPKYHRKVFYEEHRQDVRKILKNYVNGEYFILYNYTPLIFAPSMVYSRTDLTQNAILSKIFSVFF